MRHDRSQGYFIKENNSTSAQIRIARDIFISRGYKKWSFLISRKIAQD
jgi:hypothetical protein